jgi:hypothetical protein
VLKWRRSIFYVIEKEGRRTAEGKEPRENNDEQATSKERSSVGRVDDVMVDGVFSLHLHSAFELTPRGPKRALEFVLSPGKYSTFSF